jgi:hypothetical protein
VLLALWAERRVGSRGAVVVVALWALWPTTNAVLSMAYSEALFTACVAGTLLALSKDSWWWAAGACALAGLTRPTGAALLVALVAAVVVRRPGWLVGIGSCVVAASGLAVSLGHVALRLGRIDGWPWLQATWWNSGFDGGSGFASTMLQMVRGDRPSVAAYWMAAAAVVVALALLVWLLLTRPPVEEWVYAVLAVVMGVGGVNYAHCKPRFLGVVVPLFVPPAGALSRLRIGVLLVVGVVVLALSTWWSVYLVTVWPRSV